MKDATKCSVGGQWTLGRRVIGWCTDGNIDQLAETPLNEHVYRVTDVEGIEDVVDAIVANVEEHNVEEEEQ